jgi:hypothetical protein
MPDQEPTPEPSVCDSQTQSAIMTILLVHHDQRPWATDELIRDIGRRQDVLDAIANLHGAGLLHRTSDSFVFATQAAVHMDRLDL